MHLFVFVEGNGKSFKKSSGVQNTNFLNPFFLAKNKTTKNQYIAKVLEKRVFKPKIALYVFINDVYSM